MAIAYELDLAQAENRIVAYLGPEPKMIEAFETGVDIHSRTAGLIFNKPEDQISHEEGSSDIGSGTRSERYWGKQSNHSLNYGMGVRTFALNMEIQEKEARVLHEKYHRAYPGVGKYNRMVREQLNEDRTLTNLFGRKYTFLERWGGKLFNQAYAFIPQSTVGDIINRRALCYMYYNQDLFYGVEIMNQIHDSVIIQISEKHGWDYHLDCLYNLKENVEQPLSFRGREFILPLELKMMVGRYNNYFEWADWNDRKQTKESMIEKHSELEEKFYNEMGGRNVRAKTETND